MTVTSEAKEYRIERAVNSSGNRRRVSRREKRGMFKLALVVIVGVFMLIGLRAYGASIQHANNILIKENAYIQAEIDSLNSQIVEETKVTKIEYTATKEYGMVYPTSDNCIKLSDDSEDTDNLASTIRSEAYN